MLFNSIEFFLFFVITYSFYRLLPFRGQNLLLLIASYIFYGWWDVRFLFLIILSTTVDFCCTLIIAKGQLTRFERWFPAAYLTLAAFFFVIAQWQAIAIRFQPFSLVVQWEQLFPASVSSWWVLLGTLAGVGIANLFYPRLASLPDKQRQKLFLTLSICTNLGILAIFKYFNFFIDTAEALLHTLEAEADFWRLNMILPVGISFYTFQTMSYTIDVYRGKVEPTNRFLDFALYLSFFPQLLAGPIGRAPALLPQFLYKRSVSFEQSTRGLFLILLGLFKKIAIADSVAKSVNAIYGTTGTVSWLDVILATFLYTAQVYCDFSGYSDTARGIAKLFGIDLMVNFNLPYFSKTASEFWRRWHISLSTWLRDYLYIPLGGNRKGNLSTYQNLMTTMVLGGLWHGAAWNFVLWGFYQGLLLCIYRVFGYQTTEKRESLALPQFLGSLLSIFFFFLLTSYGWLLFRANSFEQVLTFTKILFVDFGNLALSMPKPTLAGLLGLPILILYEWIEYCHGNVHFYLRYSAMIRGAFYAVLTTIILMGMSNEPEQFIYFQF